MIYLEIFLETLIIALILTNMLAKKGNLGMTVGIGGGIIIGVLSGMVVYGLSSIFGEVDTILLILLEIFVVLCVFALCISILFFRDPERHPPVENGIIVSPADGRVTYIRKIENNKIPSAIKGKKNIPLSEITKTDILNNEGYIVGITMSILDVHINRSPISGKVILTKYTAGNFISLKKPMSESLNERNTIVIDNGSLKVAVVQIASRLVRKIISYVKEGDFVGIGGKIGMIKFGSQADLIMPNLDSLNIVVKEGEQVYGGISIIAKYKYSVK